MVSAVIRDAPQNSSLEYDILARMEISGDYTSKKNDWHSQNHNVFVQTAPGYTQNQVENGLRNIMKKYRVADDDYLKGRRDFFRIKTVTSWPLNWNPLHPRILMNRLPSDLI